MPDRNGSCDDYRKASAHAPSRRGFLFGASLATIGWLGSPRTALADLAIRTDRREGPTDTLVVLFLQGGMDGLNVVVPYFEDDYYRLRPTLAIPAPKASQDGRALDLDGRFGLHPALAKLLPYYESGHMAVVHAVGSGDQTRSHFEAMSAMDRGLWAGEQGEAGGWLARYLVATALDEDSPLRAVALSSVMPDALVGATHAVALDDLAGYDLRARGEERSALLGHLESLYGGKDRLDRAGADTLRVIRRLESIDTGTRGADAYPDTPVGAAMRQVAQLMHADVGLEVACVNFGGWDTHVAQGGLEGWQPGLLGELAGSLDAFIRDLGPKFERTTILVMTEFGRRASENAGYGTDHGRGSAMFVLGGHVRGGKVVGRWPGLAPHQLEEPGDLRVTTDYRIVLAEALEKRSRLKRADAVFAGLGSSRLGLLA